MKYGIDCSEYTALALAHWQEMKANGIDFAFIRGTSGLREDRRVFQHTLNARMAEIPHGLYALISPNRHLGSQVSLALSLCRQTGAKCLVLDYEIYEKLDDTIWDKTELSRFYNNATIQAKNRAHLPIAIYTARWFVDTFAPFLSLNKTINWFASYTSGTFAWPEFWNKAIAVGAPRMPTGVRHWDCWQFLGTDGSEHTTKVGGVPGCDWNVMKDDAYYRLFHWVQPVKRTVFGNWWRKLVRV